MSFNHTQNSDVSSNRNNSRSELNNTSNDSNAQRSNNGTYTETPLALLEQLVYLDNFMPQSNNNSNTDSNNSTTPTSQLRSNSSTSFNTDFDEQLSAELAAFADDSFIFADEEKPKASNSTGNDNGNSNNNNIPANNIQGINALGQLNANIPSSISELLASTSHNVGSQVNGILQQNQNQPQLQGLISAPLQQQQQQQQQQQLPQVNVPHGALSTLSAAGLSQTQINALATLIAVHQNQEANHVPIAAATTATNTNHIPVTALAPTTPSLTAAPTNTTMSPPTNYNKRSFTQAELLGHDASPSSSLSPPLNPAAYAVTPASSLSISAATPSSDPADLNATESDKRRRNTAASARFRIKKKIKEQEMERNIRELSNTAAKLELKIQQLQMENQVLRTLVIEKGNQRNNEELERLKKKAKSSVDQEEGDDNSNAGEVKVKLED